MHPFLILMLENSLNLFSFNLTFYITFQLYIVHTSYISKTLFLINPLRTDVFVVYGVEIRNMFMD